MNGITKEMISKYIPKEKPTMSWSLRIAVGFSAFGAICIFFYGIYGITSYTLEALFAIVTSICIVRVIMSHLESYK